jgi:hypothetical protein
MKKLLAIAVLLSGLIGFQVEANKIRVTNKTAFEATPWVSWAGKIGTDWYKGGMGALKPGQTAEFERNLLHRKIGGVVWVIPNLTPTEELVLKEKGVKGLQALGISTAPVRTQIKEYFSPGQAAYTDFEIVGPDEKGQFRVGRFVQ